MKSISISLLLCLNSLSGISQRNDERIYLHTDKQCYVAGETIWLKAYILLQFAPDDEISNLYLDLIDIKGNILAQKRMPVFFGTAEGSIDINLSTGQGIYLLRACTKAGLETGRAIGKTIYIFNPVSPELSIAPPKNVYNCRFFVSNNQLTAGLMNTVYYKATGVYNIPVHITGSLVDETKQEVVAFNDINNGTGMLQWQPVIGKTYTARVVFPNGTNKIYNLPPVSPEGLAISLVNEAQFISATIRQNGKYEKQKLVLLGIMGDHQAFRHEFVLSKNEYKVKIPVGDLPEGVLQMGVLSGGEQIGEAKTFIHRSDSLKIVLKKQGDSLILLFPTGTTGTFSMAVTDYDKEILPAYNNMVNELLVNQEDSGRTILPGKDFLLQQETAALIVNTIASKKISGDNPGPDNRLPFSDAAFLTLQGRVVDNKSKKPLSKGELILFYKGKDSSSSILTPVISKEGNFSVNNLIFYDTATFSYKWKGKQDARLLIDTETDKSPTTAFAISFVADTSVFSIAENKIRAQHVYTFLNATSDSGKLLQAVTVTTHTGSLRELVNKKYASGLFSGSGMARVLDLINEPPANTGLNVFDYIQGKFGDLLVTRTMMGQYTLTSTRGISIMGVSPEIKLYLDQTEVSSDIILGVRLRDIAMIKYFPPGNARLPGIGAVGVLAVYSKKPEDNSLAVDNVFARNFKFPGYSPVKEFGDADQYRRSRGNLSTIFWDPHIIVDGTDNQYTFKMEKTTTTGRLHIMVEGFTFEGNILYLDTIVQRD